MLVRLLLCILAFNLCMSGSALAACERAAGVVVYSVIDDEIHILVADHRINVARGWGAFGGCVDDKETLTEGALRELHEETRCALPESLAINNETPSVRFGRYTSFALEIPIVAADKIADAPPSARCTGIAANERGPWAWISLKKLLANLSADDEANTPFPKDFLPEAKRRWFWSKSTRVVKALHDIDGFRRGH